MQEEVPSERVAERGARGRTGRDKALRFSSEAKEARRAGAVPWSRGTQAWVLAHPDGTGAQGERARGPEWCREVGTVSQ